MCFRGSRIQRKLRPLCRAVQYSCTLSLVIFTVYVYFTSVRSQFDSVPQWDADFTAVPSRVACSSNMISTREGCVSCPRGTFSFPGWSECTPWLNCSEIALQVRPTRRFHHGITKLVWHAEWNGYHVVFINCSARDALKREHCSKGMSNLERIQGQFVTPLIGSCPEKLQVRKTMTDGLILDFLSKKVCVYLGLAHTN